jgi:hypothetical protein
MRALTLAAAARAKKGQRGAGDHETATNRERQRRAKARKGWMLDQGRDRAGEKTGKASALHNTISQLVQKFLRSI